MYNELTEHARICTADGRNSFKCKSNIQSEQPRTVQLSCGPAAGCRVYAICHGCSSDDQKNWGPQWARPDALLCQAQVLTVLSLALGVTMGRCCRRLDFTQPDSTHMVGAVLCSVCNPLNTRHCQLHVLQNFNHEVPH